MIEIFAGFYILGCIAIPVLIAKMMGAGLNDSNEAWSPYDHFGED